MIYLAAGAILCLAFICLDLKWNKDPFSPLIWGLFFHLMIYIFPGFFQGWVADNAQMQVFHLYPFEKYREFLVETPALAILSYVTGFGISYLMSLFIFKRHKIKALSFEIDKIGLLKKLNYLGIIGSLFLFPLLRFHDPYYHMKGLGWANWLASIFGFVLGFLSITIKETRKIAIINLFFAISAYLFVLDRKMNSIQLMLGLLIIFINFRKIWTWKKLAMVSLFFLILLVGKYSSVWKIYDRIMPPGTNTTLNKTKLLIGGEVGRFDLIASIFQVRTPGMSYDPLLFLRKIPFSGYIPYVKEKNRAYGEVSETWLYGKKIAPAGGIPIMELHEIYFIFNSHLAIFLFMLMMGILWAYFYETTSRLSSRLATAIYALFWIGNSQAMVPEVLFSLLALFFIIILGKIRIREV